jgi:tRNA (cmo5U34)-methyltransferase
MRNNGEDDEFWLKKYINEDRPATVEQQIAWLNEIGFTDTGCHWRYFNYAIFGGRKQKGLP